MTAAERRVFKGVLRSAIRKQAPLAAEEETALLLLTRFKDIDAHGARTVAAWASGVPAFSVVAFYERCSPRTLQTRLAAILREFVK
jgi:hypothetical protein